MIQYLGIVEDILRDRPDFFAQVRDSDHVHLKNFGMFVSSVAFLAGYGAIMGGAHSIPQAVSAAVKLPMLFIVTLAICTPSLYFFNLLFGSQRTLPQTVALLLTAMTVTSVLLLSLAPVMLFFLLTTSSYPFLKLLNVGFFAVSGALGVLFLRQGLVAFAPVDKEEGAGARRIIFFCWVWLYAFVGTQMSWTLSPFIGDPNTPFILFRHPDGSNFYVDVATSLDLLLRGF